MVGDEDNTLKAGNQPKLANLSALVTFLGQHWLILLALIPLFRILVLTSWDGSFTNWQSSSRISWLPSLYVELAVICIALLHKMSALQMFRDLSRLVQLLACGWLVALVTASSSATFPQLAVMSAVIWIVHLLFAVSIVHLVRCYDINCISMVRNFCLVLAASSALTGAAIFAFVTITGVDSAYDWKSSLPGYAHIRHTGYIFAPAIASGLAGMAVWPKFQSKPHAILLMVNITAMLWLGSRGPAAALILAVGITALFSSHFHTRLFWKHAGIATAAGSILSILLPAPTIGWFGAIQRFWNGNTGPSDLSSGRTEIWLETIRLISDRPWLGFGGMQFQHVNSAAAGFFKHPHNSILQFAFDWGLLGCTAMLLMLAIAYFRLVLGKSIDSRLRSFGLLGATTMLAFSMLDGILFYNFTIAVTIIFLLLPLASLSPDETGASGHPFPSL
ncbi:O-antigen ligase family protein [Parasphingorhabdus sp.]|uniref:O-antigen ligase family protein n=1 Tax=Parasphingorhabdus sp. TaxID=2709688 RepID=UPI0030022E06